MKKQAAILVTGDFNLVEFKNYLIYKITTFNLQSKMQEHVDVTGKIDISTPNNIRIALQGEERDINIVYDWAKRGPVISHITSYSIKWKPIKGRFPQFV